MYLGVWRKGQSRNWKNNQKRLGVQLKIPKMQPNFQRDVAFYSLSQGEMRSSCSGAPEEAQTDW